MAVADLSADGARETAELITKAGGSVVHGYSTRLIKYLWCCHGRCGSKNPRF
jgi:hypothetical protein